MRIEINFSRGYGLVLSLFALILLYAAYTPKTGPFLKALFVIGAIALAYFALRFFTAGVYDSKSRNRVQEIIIEVWRKYGPTNIPGNLKEIENALEIRLIPDSYFEFIKHCPKGLRLETKGSHMHGEIIIFGLSDIVDETKTGKKSLKIPLKEKKYFIFAATEKLSGNGKELYSKVFVLVDHTYAYREYSVYSWDGTRLMEEARTFAKFLADLTAKDCKMIGYVE